MNISDFKGYFDLDLLYKERWNLEKSKISGGNHCSEYFDLGYSCAEASFMAICDMLEVEDGPNSCVATCFGGGMGRNNLICGANRREVEQDISDTVRTERTGIFDIQGVHQHI